MTETTVELENTADRAEIASAASAEASTSQAGLRRRVLGLAWPVIAENFLETLLGIVDTILVAHLGAAAIAGVGMAQQMMFLLIAALSALSVGSAVLVAQSVGARDLSRASRLARQSLLWSVVISIPLAIAGIVLAQPFVSLFGLEPEVAEIAVSYLYVTMGTVVVLVALLIGSGVLRGAGDSRTPMIVTAIANVMNVVLAYGLINGAFGLPNLGAVGSAWATFLARAFALVLLLIVLWRGRNGVTIKGGSWRLNTGVAKQVLGIGLPAALEQILNNIAFLALNIVVASLGTVALAAHRLNFTALSFSFLPGFGFSIAATALVGQSIGARRAGEARQIARIAATWAVIWMSTIGLLLLFFPAYALSIFTSDSPVIDAGLGGLRMVALAQPVWAILFVYAGSLRGTGDTRSPLIITSGGLWITVGLAWLGLKLFGGGLVTVWAAFVITSPLFALALIWRFRHRIASLSVSLAHA